MPDRHRITPPARTSRRKRPAARTPAALAAIAGLGLTLCAGYVLWQWQYAGPVALASYALDQPDPGLFALRRIDLAVADAFERGDIEIQNHRPAAPQWGEASTGLRLLLRQRPADGNYWALHALADSSLYGVTPVLLGELDMSRLTARLEFAATRRRLQVALRNWRQIGEEERSAVTRDAQVLLMMEPPHRIIADFADYSRGPGAEAQAAARGLVAMFRPDWVATYDQDLREPPKL